jgi:hypothetical protein
VGIFVRPAKGAFGSSAMGSAGGWCRASGGWGTVVGFDAVMLAIVRPSAIRLHGLERR